MMRGQPASAATVSLALLAVGALLVPSGAAAATVEVNLLCVHGVKSCPRERQNAQSSFTDLEQADAAAGQCGEVAFTGPPPSPSCTFSSGGSAIAYR